MKPIAKHEILDVPVITKEEVITLHPPATGRLDFTEKTIKILN